MRDEERRRRRRYKTDRRIENGESKCQHRYREKRQPACHLPFLPSSSHVYVLMLFPPSFLQSFSSLLLLFFSKCQKWLDAFSFFRAAR